MMRGLILDNPSGPDGRFNVGDDVQALAARQFCQKSDRLIGKSKLHDYAGAPAKVMMNGWFMHNPQQWPPSDNIEPLMVSFHMNPKPAVQMLHRGQAFFEKFAPIGCRDAQTLALFQDAGIPAYHSGCLTLTLNRKDFLGSSSNPRSGILAVDVLYKSQRSHGRLNRLLGRFVGQPDPKNLHQRRVSDIVSELVPAKRLADVQYVTNSHSIERDDPKTRYKTATNFLGQLAEAELVITSRIHAALPCLAFGTPVIFVDGGLNDPADRARLDGISDLMPVLRVSVDGTPDFSALHRCFAPRLVAKRHARVTRLRSDLTRRCHSFWGREMQAG